MLVAVVTDDDGFEGVDLIDHAVELGRMIPRHDDHSTRGVVEHVQVRLALVARVKRHTHHVCHRGTEEEVGRLDAVVFEHPDPITRHKPGCD